MKAITILLLFAGFAVSAQLASYDRFASFYVTSDTAISLNSYETFIAADLAAGSIELLIDAPSPEMKNFKVTLIQYNTGLVRQLVLNTTDATGDEFRKGNSSISFTTLPTGVYKKEVWAGLKTGPAQYQWVLVSD